MRREAIDKINKMFGHNIEVNYREDYREIDYDTMVQPASEGEPGETKRMFARAEGD